MPLRFSYSCLYETKGGLYMSDFYVFLVEKLGRIPEEIQEYFYENPEELEKLYGKKRMEELQKEYLRLVKQGV